MRIITQLSESVNEPLVHPPRRYARTVTPEELANLAHLTAPAI
jgi:hypothetical protein